MARRDWRTLTLTALGCAAALSTSADARGGGGSQEGACAAMAWLERTERWMVGIPDAARAEVNAALDGARARLAETLGVHLLISGAGEPEVWVRPEDGAPVPARVVLLVHGLDDPGTIWDEVAPALRAAGHEVARFNYPNDQPIARSADLLGGALEDLRVRGVEQVDLVCHSMGGLVARDTLTRCEHYAGDAHACARLPAIDRFITFGTPNDGAPLARLRFVMEIRDQLERLAAPGASWNTDLLGFLVDGTGEAAADLLPGSAYLTELNSRPFPLGVRATIVEGRAFPVSPSDAQGWMDHPALRAALSVEGAEALGGVLSGALAALGDGAVPEGSVPLPGAPEPVLLDADHRSMLRRMGPMAALGGLLGRDDGPPPGIALLLQELDDRGP